MWFGKIRGESSMSPFLAYWDVGPVRHHGHVSGSNWGSGWNNHNSGWYDRGYESHTVERYQGRMDDATRNWMIGGAVGNIIAGFIAPNDPEAARVIGTLSNVASTVGIIRDAGRERYHYENHEYGRESGAWNQSNNGWYSGSSVQVNNDFGWMNGGNPWICYNNGSSYQRGYNNGYADGSINQFLMDTLGGY